MKKPLINPVSPFPLFMVYLILLVGAVSFWPSDGDFSEFSGPLDDVIFFSLLTAVSILFVVLFIKNAGEWDKLRGFIRSSIGAQADEVDQLSVAVDEELEELDLGVKYQEGLALVGQVEPAPTVDNPSGIIKSPYFKKDCLWYQTKISSTYLQTRWYGIFITNDFEETRELVSTQPFYLNDQTGKVLVNPELSFMEDCGEVLKAEEHHDPSDAAGYRSKLAWAHFQSAGFWAEWFGLVWIFLVGLIPMSTKHKYLVSLRVEERYLAPNERINSWGQARRGGKELEMAALGQGLVLSKKGITELNRHSYDRSFFAKLMATGAGLVAFASLILILVNLISFTGSSLTW